MRILKISDVYFPRVNGVSTSIRTFGHELLRQGHEVTLIAPEYPQPFDDDLEILRVPSRYLHLDPEDRLMRPRVVRRLLPELRGRGFDIVHVHTPFAAHYAGLWLGDALGVPVVESYHTYFEEYLDKYLTWLPRGALRYVARRFSRGQCGAVDALVVPTQPMLDVLRGYGISTHAEVIPTGLPAGAFVRGDGAAFRRRHGIAAERPVMLYVGRVAHEKNLDFLLRVAEHVRKSVSNVLLVIAGEGPAVRHLRRLIEALGLQTHVQFVGYLTRDKELPDCYAAGDVFVFASRTETQGLVLLEAMAAGLPVVALSAMGTTDILGPERGARIAPDDPDGFAAVVVGVLADPRLRRRLAAEARDYAAEWADGVMAGRLAALYRRLLAAPQAAQSQNASRIAATR